MPPKKKAPDASKKVQDKVKQKVVEDKTFGLKNKKGKKQQTYIKNVASQVQGNVKKSAAEAAPKLSKKEQEKQKLEELNALFKPVQKAQTVAAGVDPKSVLCSFFKQGQCHKGNRCKFSHDLAVERKSEKRSLYDDARDEKEESMNDWDQETLEEVVKKKHGSTNTNKTEIICKYFLEAVEKNLYGWFWNCPNGDKCMYRHALPPGFVLKRDQKKEEDESEKVSLEEHIENERNQLSGELTPVTKETFLAWKKRKIAEKKEKLNQELNKKKDDFKAGKGMMKISGKEVFLFKPELADADDDEADDEVYRYNDEDEDEQPCTEINIDVFSAESMSDVDNSKLTKATTLLARDRLTAHAPTSLSGSGTGYDESNTESTDVNGLDQACATIETTNSADVVIDESLFEDLDDLDLEDGD